ncbi:hypothetical protein C8F04DRAFT_1234626 [Mycena alexandri]|uniref:Uncharacterized protein n=1 Tax=Mycena alexandri TaxID=1745969 RepID=A0AAD6SV37_9AGAR|nr:hypothetical protein C8F04DRAFT_1234626 [Mycena alexandri]
MAPPPGMKCPLCGNYIVAKLTKSGLHPHTYLAQCLNPAHQYFNYRWGPEYSPTSPTTQPASTKPSKTRTTSDSQCCAYTSQRGVRCTSSRLNAACSNLMCRKHCQATGRCVLVPHRNTTATTPSRKAPVFSPPPPTLTSALSARDPSPFGLGFVDMAADLARPLQVLQQHHDQEQARLAEQKRQLDLALGIIPDSPNLSVDEMLQMELARSGDDDFSVALRLNAELNNSTSIFFPPSSPPTAVAGPSHQALRPLSPSPDFPVAVSNTPHRPRSRTPAASLAGKAKPTPRTRITTQLNETWMASNGGPSSYQVQAPSVSASVFHVRQGGKRRAFVERGQIERFMLVFLRDTVPLITSVNVADIVELTWPNYKLSVDTKTCQALGDNLDLEVYLPDPQVWMRIPLNHVHAVATDSVLILRRFGAPDDEPTMNRFFPKTSAPARHHLRHNLPGERAAVRSGIKVHKTKARGANSPLFIINSDSEDDMEIGPVTPFEGKCTVKRERDVEEVDGDDDDETNPYPLTQRRRLSPNVRPELTIDTTVAAVRAPSTTSSTTDTPPASALSLYSPALSSASEDTPEDFVAPWPAGMYVVDMVAGFMAMKADEIKHMSPAERFCHVFKVPYRHSTYDDNVRRWKRASRPLQRRCIEAGRTEAGLWSTLRAVLNAEGA